MIIIVTKKTERIGEGDDSFTREYWTIGLNRLIYIYIYFGGESIRTKPLIIFQAPIIF